MGNITVVASEQDTDLRADVFVYENAPITSRSKAQSLFKNKLVKVNSKLCKASYRVTNGDCFEVGLLDDENDDAYLKPYNIDLNILFEDNDFMVINKQGGLVVHPGAGHISDTLVNALIYHKKKMSAGSMNTRPGIVHRLDKDTSGLLLVAKNDQSHINLVKQFEKRAVLRNYLALVYGTPKNESGRIQSRLVRHSGNRKIFTSSGLSDKGKIAITNYEVLKTVEGLSLLRLKLETGRTHQIRVHLSELGNPIVADRVYAKGRKVKGKKVQALIEDLPQMALHSAFIRFDHPSKNFEMSFECNWHNHMLEFIKMTGLD